MRVTAMIFGAATAAVSFAACSDSLHLDPPAAPPGTTVTGTGGDPTGGGGGAATTCRSNSDCPAPTAVCDTVKQSCVECLEIQDCAFRPGTVCSEGDCVCPKPGESFCEPAGGAPARCANLETSSADCGTCGHACFGACNSSKCADAWEPTAVANAPTPRRRHVAVWADTRMIVWGGDGQDGAPVRTGGVYDPATRLWTPTSTANAPSARYSSAAVWTGSTMIVWGGTDGTPLATGGIFNPATNTWTPMSTKSAPSPRYQHTVVWTGTKVLVWGGFDNTANLSTGGSYDPAMDTWTPISDGAAPFPRRGHTAVWTGTRMLVFGGYGFDGTVDNMYLNGGGEFDPDANSWVPLQTISQPTARMNHTAVWTGTEMLVWGGDASGVNAQDGSKYSVQQNAWTPMNGPFPDARSLHTAVWLKDKMIVWGGYNGGSLNTGGIFNPVTNTWDPKGMPTALSARHHHTAVATGNTMIVWGGESNGTMTNTGGVFDPAFTP